jgi:hypothetical protein
MFEKFPILFRAQNEQSLDDSIAAREGHPFAHADSRAERLVFPHLPSL